MYTLPPRVGHCTLELLCACHAIEMSLTEAVACKTSKEAINKPCCHVTNDSINRSMFGCLTNQFVREKDAWVTFALCDELTSRAVGGAWLYALTPAVVIVLW